MKTTRASSEFQVSDNPIPRRRDCILFKWWFSAASCVKGQLRQIVLRPIPTQLVQGLVPQALLLVCAMAFVRGDHANAAIMLDSDSSEITGIVSGQLAVAYKTVAPLGPSTNIGRFFDSPSGYYFNGGSFVGGGIGAAYNGQYKITQMSPLGTDGVSVQLSLKSQSGASTDPNAVSFWEISPTDLYASARTETKVMLNFRTSQSNASYSVSFQGPFDGASVTVNDVAPSPGNLAFPVRSDTNGFLHFSAVLTSQFAAPPNGDDAREALLTFQLQPAIEPPHLEFTGFSTTALNTGQLGVKVNLSASESASGPWNTSFSVSPNEDFYRFVSFSLQLGDNTIQLDLKALDIERFSEDVSLRVLAVTQSPIGSPSIPPQTNMAIIEIPLPVIFVHGYLGTSCGNPFGLSGSFVPSQKAGLFDYLVTQSTQVGISRIPYSESGDYPTLSMFNWIGIANDSAESIAERLRGHIANQLGATYATKVNLLTHSLGGLLARLAIDQGAPVRKLIMVGCPNNGTSYVWEMSSCLTLDKVNAIANGIVGYAVPRTDVFPFTTQGPYQKGNPCAIQPLALQRRTPPSLPSDPSLQIFNIFTSDSGTDTAWDYVATFQKKQNWYGFTRRALRIAQGCDSRTVWSFYRIGDGVISVQDATLGIGLDIRVQTDEKVNGFGFPHALQLQNAAVLEAIARALGLLK